MNRVVVVGSMNLDLVIMSERLPSPGETVLGSDLQRHAGGKGANQAVAAARLGASVTLHAAVGDDPFGAELLHALGQEPLDLSPVKRLRGSGTGVAIIAVDRVGANAIIVSPGANGRLGPEVGSDLISGLQPGDVVLMQLEIPLGTCVAVAEAAQRQGAQVVLNAAPAVHGEPRLTQLLRASDVLIVNEHEALTLLGGLAGSVAGDWHELAARLTSLGPPNVVITIGARGAVLACGGATDHHPAFTVPVIDTTGAGDAFCGAFAAALAAGLGVPEAVRRGCAAGAAAATALGAQQALPHSAELEALLSAETPPTETEVITPAGTDP